MIARFSICIEMIFQELPLETRIEQVALAGFRGIEFWDWRDKPLDAIAAQCSRLGLQVTTISGHRRGSLMDPTEFELYQNEVVASVVAAQEVSCKNLMLLTNPLDSDGRVLSRYPHIRHRKKYANCVEALSRLVPLAKQHDVLLLLEPLNTIIDHPGYWLDNADWAFDIIREVDCSRVRLLYDFYHMHVMGRNVHEDIEENLDVIGYVHAADHPGRHEPGTGNIDYPSILRLLKSLDYDGVVGFEFVPRDTSDKALKSIYVLSELFL